MEIMEAIKLLESMGISLPSPLYIVGALLFGIIGMVFFYQGTKNKLKVPLWVGLALMFYPYVVWNTQAMYMVGAVLTIVGFVFRDQKFK